MMNTCERIRLQLTDFAAGDLAAPEAAAVARHLDGCPACREEMEAERSLREILGSLPTVRSPGGIGDFVPARRVPRPDRARWRWGAGFAAAAGLAAILVGGFLDRAPQNRWTEAELAAARHDVITTLGLAAEAIERGQRTAVVETFGQRLPRAVTGSLKLKSPEQGEEG
jgi:anti-sigma factor RsiW